MPSTSSILKYAHSVRLAYRLEEATAAWLSCPDASCPDASAETATEAAIKLEASSSAHPAVVQGALRSIVLLSECCAPYTVLHRIRTVLRAWIFVVFTKTSGSRVLLTSGAVHSVPPMISVL